MIVIESPLLDEGFWRFMPVSTSAKKALRKDRRRTVVNNVVRAKMRTAVKRFRDEKTEASLSEMYSTLDRAVKRNIIHRKKAARVKSRLSKLLDKTVSTEKSKAAASAPKKQASGTQKKAATTKKAATA